MFPLNTSGSTLASEIQRVCHDNELVISAWSPIHLRDTLNKLYWKDGKDAVGAMAFWEDMQRYLYLPRLEGRNILEQAIIKGAGSRDFFGTAYGRTGDVYQARGFRECKEPWIQDLDVGVTISALSRLSREQVAARKH